MKWEVSADLDEHGFDEAVQWFQARTLLTAEDAEQLDARAKRDAFWVGAGFQLSQIQRVFDEIAKAEASGEPFEDWRKRTADLFIEPRHQDLVFRNAVQRSYNAGRYAQMRDADVIDARPYWQFDAVHDSRLSQICREIDPPAGPPCILPADDPFWATHTPPLHHGCRSGIRSLRTTTAKRLGISTQRPDIKADRGFGIAPTDDDGSQLKPDTKKIDPELGKELERKAKQPRERKPGKLGKPKPKGPPPEHDPAYWTKHYAEQYGDAAGAVAWGRAMQERGLDLMPKEIWAALKPLRELTPPPLWVERLEATLRNVEQQRQKLRDQAQGQLPEVRAAAAVAAHLKAIETGSIDMRGPDQRGRRCVAFYQRLSDKSVQQPRGATNRPDRDQYRMTPQSDGRSWHSAGGNGYAGKIVYSQRTGAVEHEWGHALETLNEPVLKRSKAFLDARTRGELQQPLRDLIPGSGYDSKEYAKPDKFLHAYMGKQYDDATELMSMGAESLAGSGSVPFGDLAARDPEMLWFILGQLGKAA